MNDKKNNTGDYNAGSYNTSCRNIGDWNTGHRNIGHRNTGHRNAGNLNTGNWNTGDRNTGFFNTITPSTVMVFNGVMVDREEFNDACPDWLYKPSPVTRVSESEMTEQEKIDNPTFKTCGGYLRKNDRFEEWAKAYASASPEDVQKVRDLPGFDYDVFQEITGLDLRIAEKSECVPPPSITINGIRYVMDDKQ